MRKFVFSLVLFFGGCLDFALFCIASAIVGGGYLLPVLCLFSFVLMIYGAMAAYSVVLEEQDVPSPEEQNDKPARQGPKNRSEAK